MAYNPQKRFFFRKNSGIGINSIDLFGEEMIFRAQAESGSFSEFKSECAIQDENNILQNG